MAAKAKPKLDERMFQVGAYILKDHRMLEVTGLKRVSNKRVVIVEDICSFAESSLTEKQLLDCEFKRMAQP